MEMNFQKGNIKTILAIVVLVLIVGAWWISNLPSKSVTSNESVEQNLPVNNDPNQRVLSVVKAESKATYEIDEDLNKVPTHVVGNTSEIMGTVAVFNNDYSKIQIRNIKLDARSFKTDIAKRDENVVKFVLESDKPGNESISFEPTNISGFPSLMEKSKDYPVTVIGDIVIKGVVRLASFEGTARLVDDNSLRLVLSTTINRNDFNVSIPNFPFLSNVSPMVKLTVDLVLR